MSYPPLERRRKARASWQLYTCLTALFVVQLIAVTGLALIGWALIKPISKWTADKSSAAECPHIAIASFVIFPANIEVLNHAIDINRIIGLNKVFSGFGVDYFGSSTAKFVSNVSQHGAICWRRVGGNR